MEPGGVIGRTVSPELVLIDPELAAEARAALVDQPWPPVPRIDAKTAAPARAGRRGPVGLFLAIGFVLGFGVTVLSVLPPRDRPTLAAQPPRSTPQIPPRSSVRLTVAPSFSWPPHADARYYQATFLRAGKAFYRAKTSRPRVRLPARIRITPGRYRWIVRPAIGSRRGIRLGSPIVDSTFRVGGD